ncbi:MAG: anthranilate phosphoribosyltransferase [Phycisphaerales bacterium]|nr:anthranilate phosphoribosyltransferase [Phycisphaerales bacterium]
MTTPPSFNPIPTLRLLLDGQHLDAESVTHIFEAMMSGDLKESQTAAVLSLIAVRDPDANELASAAAVMRKHVTAIPTSIDLQSLLDTAGTGGAPKTFNVSTAAAIVAAASGIPVAKHGNRSRTGRGSAEVLEMLGVNINAGPDTQAHCLQEANVCFAFAIHHHPATRFVMPVRRALTFPTIFNLLGPLTNPANAHRQVIGVWDSRFGQVMAEALVQLGTKRAIVAHSHDGLDEVSISAPTTLWHVENGEIHQEVISPIDVGLQLHSIDDVRATNLEHAASLVRSVLDGSEQGAPRDMVLINAAAAILVGGKSVNLTEGVAMAASMIDTGHAITTLKRLVEVSQSVVS